MTPTEKALELVAIYSKILPMNQTTLLDHKNCALIAINEILLGYMGNPKVKYWEQVKEEIEKVQ